MTYRLVVSTDQGEREVLQPDDLIVFIDETGEEKFADPKYPIFGFGGCASLARSYNGTIKKPWDRLKRRFFGGVGSSMHAVELRSPNEHQIAALAKFFGKYQFLRFAAVATKNTQIGNRFTAFEALAYTFCSQIVELINLNDMNAGRIVLIFEHSTRGNRLARRYFDKVAFARDGGGFIPKLCGFMHKTENEAGLEVADFVAYTAGVQVNKPRGEWRKDFRAIFVDIDRRLSAFRSVDSVIFTPRG